MYTGTLCHIYSSRCRATHHPFVCLFGFRSHRRQRSLLAPITAVCFMLLGFRFVRCFTVPHYFSNSPLSGARGIFLPCRFSRGKIPDYEHEEIIQLVFGGIFVCYIYFLLQAISALNNDNDEQNDSEKKRKANDNEHTAIDYLCFIRSMRSDVKFWPWVA